MASVNTIALAERYLPILDAIYKRSAITSMFDAARVEFIGAKSVRYYKISMSGLGNYNRNAGFPQGSVNGEWEQLTLAMDRGTSFSVDSMDNEESLNQAFGPTTSEFIRTRVVPEVDAYTFQKFASKAGVTLVQADLTEASDVYPLIRAAESAMNDNEVPMEGRVLFISEVVATALESKIDRSYTNEGNVSHMVEMLDGMRVVHVPRSRFYSKITVNDLAAAAVSSGGYTIPSDAYKLNFMIVHPSAVLKVVKHALPRIFSPAVNQEADAWKFDYRIYHDAFVYDNKVTGVYVHEAATAGA